MFRKVPAVLIVCVLGIGFLACTDDSISLTIRLRTDYQPLRDFIGVDIIVDEGSPTTRTAKIDGQYVEPGVELATFESLNAAEERSINLELTRTDGTAPFAAGVVIAHDKDLILTVSVTRDCGAMVCSPVDGVAQRCLAGRCVDATCTSGSQDPNCIFSDVPECVDAEDCAIESSCAVRSCVEGICFVNATGRGLCEVGFVCDIEEDACVIDPLESCMPESIDADCMRRSDCIPAECVNNLCIYRLAPDETTCTPGIGGAGSCLSGACQPQGCQDGILNQDETDIDCGGTICGKCIGTPCSADSECASGVCDLIESMTCEAADVCGNTKTDAGEGCDDGNVANGDGCNGNCLIELDGMCTLDAACETGLCFGGLCKIKLGDPCTDHAACASTVCDMVGSNTCEPADVCGNGLQETGEACDDGNTAGGDGCGTTCLFALGQVCSDSLDCESGFCAGTCFQTVSNNIRPPFGANTDSLSDVALSGDYYAFGAPLEDSCAGGVRTSVASDNGCMSSGAAYVYRRTGSDWNFHSYIKGNASQNSQFFGDSVALEGDTLAVASTTGSGYVRIFRLVSGTWTVEATLTASNAASLDRFGSSIALSGDTIVIGAEGEDSCAPDVGGNELDDMCPGAGAAYVFTRSGTLWTQQAYLKANAPGDDDAFGTDVDIEGDTIVVTADNEDSCTDGVDTVPNDSCDNAGAAYVFDRAGVIWSPGGYLKASNSEAGDFFGNSVTIDGTRIVVGAPDEAGCATTVDGTMGNGCTRAGAAYSYTFNGGTGKWEPEAYFKVSNGEAQDQLGSDVFLRGDQLLIGAEGEDGCDRGFGGNEMDNACLNSGAIYSFRFDGAWSQTHYIKSQGDTLKVFGMTISGDDNGLILGGFSANNIASINVLDNR